MGQPIWPVYTLAESDQLKYTRCTHRVLPRYSPVSRKTAGLTRFPQVNLDTGGK